MENVGMEDGLAGLGPPYGWRASARCPAPRRALLTAQGERVALTETAVQLAVERGSPGTEALLARFPLLQRALDMAQDLRADAGLKLDGSLGPK
jgi:hypothetical protein